MAVVGVLTHHDQNGLSGATVFAASTFFDTFKELNSKPEWHNHR